MGTATGQLIPNMTELNPSNIESQGWKHDSSRFSKVPRRLK
jgi:hypothetical protein